MTTDLIELSKQAAEVLGIEPMEIYPSHFSFTDKTIHSFSTLWLVEDSWRCADVAADKEMKICWKHGYVIATIFIGQFGDKVEGVVKLADYNGDRKQAWRVAVLKAVIEQDRMG